MLETALTVRDLRRRWKPHKERLAGHPTAIRFHRACSWLDRAEKLDPTADSDLLLINQWIALNALYGRWDAGACEPYPDRGSWQSFLSRILHLDATGFVGDSLIEHKPLVLSILEDEYLAGFFWKAPSIQSKQLARNQRQRALSSYVEKNWTVILDRLLERIYLLRCQLIHGAATCGGKLNRTSLKRCTQMLGHLLPAMLLVITDHGADDDWGQLCYPPMERLPTSANNSGFRPRQPR